jgi:putative drug exporter of the RND superfamily
MARLPAGRWSKWLVVGFWLVVFGVAGPLAGRLNSAQQNDASSWLPHNAESTQVVELAKRFAPADIFPALVVYERPDGPITPADQAKAAADARRFATIQDVTGKVIGPVPASDGRALQVVVPIRVAEEGNGWEELTPRVEALRSIAQADTGGLGVYVTGPAGYFADFANVFSGFDSTLLSITAVIVVVILLVTYRSPVLWLLPLSCVFVALTAAQAVIYLLARNGGLTVNGQSAFILTVLVFGAGTDYALLLTARYREELRRHADRHQAMAVALGRAAPAIIASGATVILSLLCLLVAELASTRSLGPVMAIGVAVGLLAMLALLVIVGRWVFWPRRPTLGSAEPTERGLWARIGQRVAHRPRLVWVVTAVVLGLLALGTTGLEANGLQSKDAFRTKPEAVTGEQVLARHFAAGAGNPVQVVGNASAAPQLQATLAGTAGVTAVTRPVIRDGAAYLEGTLTSSPDSQASYDLVDRLRVSVHAIGGAQARVGGGSAVNLDILRASRHDRNLVVPLVLVVVAIILGLLLRAVVAPLLLVATVVLSFGAALGVSTLVFDHLFGFAGADPSFPLWTFVFLVALGTDYNIFLMTRVHEEAKVHRTRRGALIGLAATGGVITSAGVVLAGTFAALGTLPLVFVTEIGFAVAFGVLLDTFVVRSVLVTALNLDVGRRIWWPSRLARTQDVPLDQLAQDEPAAMTP